MLRIRNTPPRQPRQSYAKPQKNIRRNPDDRVADGRILYPTFTIAPQAPPASAVKRLMRDLAELQREELLTVSACPQDDDLFEWHVNIKAPDGVYAGAYLHCVMRFPPEYPRRPPQISCSTPISHPNLFSGGYICLSMLKEYSAQFEGWSCAYSAASILCQLQSFFFADEIRQTSGRYVSSDSRYRDHDTVKRSLDLCRRFRCATCGHSHNKPFPPVAIDNVQQTVVMKGVQRGVSIDGTNIQTMVEHWVGAYAEQSVYRGRAMYEVLVQWTGDEWRRDNITGGLCRFGWGTRNSSACGLRNDYSVGYGGTAKWSYDGTFRDFGETFTKGDVITCAVDFDDGVFLFGKNGYLLDPPIPIPRGMEGEELYPLASFKNARAEFNFGKPNRAIPELDDFVPMGLLLEYEAELDREMEGDGRPPFTGWTDLPDDVSMVVLRFLDSVSLYCASWATRHWYRVFDKYSLAARQEVACFYTKIPYSQCTLGFGLSMNERRVYSSEMDYLSNFAWESGVREAVWGSRLETWIPLIINLSHARRSMPLIDRALDSINPKNRALAVAKVMNDIVVGLAMSANNASTKSVRCIMDMNVSVKALLGYASLHHMLLYLVENDDQVAAYAHSVVNKLKTNRLLKKQTRDLGQALVFLSVVEGSCWEWICKSFTIEVWTRNVLWFTRTNSRWNSPTTKNWQAIFKSTAVSRCVVMFQIFFSRLVNSGGSTAEQLDAYNRRLGRPPQQMILKLHAFCRQFVEVAQQGVKEQWAFYWKSIGLKRPSSADFVNFLRVCVSASERNEYHTPSSSILAPDKGFRVKSFLRFTDEAEERVGAARHASRNVQNPTAAETSGSSDSGPTSSAARGRGRGGGNRGRGRGRGRGNSSPVNAEAAEQPRRKKRKKNRGRQNN